MLNGIQTSEDIEYLQPVLDCEDSLSKRLDHDLRVRRDIIVSPSFPRLGSNDYQVGDSLTQGSAFFFVDFHCL